MKLKKFELKVRQYGGVDDVTAELPVDLMWITNLDSSDKYNDYLSVMNKDEYEEFMRLTNETHPFKLYSYELLDKVILLYKDVGDSNEFPLMITEEELSSKVNIDDYCIINMNKNYRVVCIYKLYDLISSVGFINYKRVDLFDDIRDIPDHGLSKGCKELDSMLLSFNENKIIKIVKGDVAKKFWNAGLREVIDEFNPDFSIPIDEIQWSAGITDEDFKTDDLSKVIEKLNKFNEQFK